MSARGARLLLAIAGLASPAALVAAEPAANTLSVVVPTPDAAADPRDVAAQRRIDEANDLIEAKRSRDALPILDAVLADYAARFPPGPTRWYVARSDKESTHYLVLNVFGPEEGKTGTSVLRNGWSYAWYRKGYALMELQRPAEARAALDEALALSPANSTVLIERAEASKLERAWDDALALYRAAEQAVEYAPDELAGRDRAQAMRGQAFVFIEQGKLDEAERILRACLALDADDARAKQELEYIAKLRATAKP